MINPFGIGVKRLVNPNVAKREKHIGSLEFWESVVMLGSLLRRRNSRPYGQDQAAFGSTQFTLTSEVPRPIEAPCDDGIVPLLRTAKLVDANGAEQLIRVRNLTAGGMMAQVSKPQQVGDVVSIEMSSQQIPASVVWTRESTAGYKFDSDIDLSELLAGRKPRHGFRPRPPRLKVDCKANVRIGKLYYTVDVHDISLGGIKVEPIQEYCLGQKVVVVVESLRPIKGEIRWFSDRKAGIVFDKPLGFEELAEWMAKRIEMASLKASLK